MSGPIKCGACGCSLYTVAAANMHATICLVGPAARASLALAAVTLAAKDARIAELLDLLQMLRGQTCCENYNHREGEYHKIGGPCPIEARIDALIEKARAR